VFLGIATAQSVVAEDTIIYDHITGKGFNKEVRFLDLSEPASDIDPDPENWESISRVGAKLGLAGTGRLVTQVDVQLDNYLPRRYTGNMFLQFHQDDAVGGGPGTPIGPEITAPISVDTVYDGSFLNVIDFSFTGLSTDLSGFDTVWYSLGIRDVVYSGGTGGFYLSQISDLNGPSVGTLGFGFWELRPPSDPSAGWNPIEGLADQYPNIRIFAAAEGLTGDYNNDGKVDAADYVVWRKTEIGGQQGYDDWRDHYGAMNGSGSRGQGVGATVPEPTCSGLLTALGFAMVWAVGRRRQQALDT
jgi:hypothetical protein